MCQCHWLSEGDHDILPAVVGPCLTSAVINSQSGLTTEAQYCHHLLAKCMHVFVCFRLWLLEWLSCDVSLQTLITFHVSQHYYYLWVLFWQKVEKKYPLVWSMQTIACDVTQCSLIGASHKLAGNEAGCIVRAGGGNHVAESVHKVGVRPKVSLLPVVLAYRQRCCHLNGF